MEAIAAGEMIDLEGFDSQYGALFGDLSALARALGAGSDAEDVAQEALLEARSHLHQLRDPVKLRAWVRRIAVRGACRARRRHLADLDAEQIERLPVTELPNLDVAAAIAGLPERERVAVTLVFGLGYRQDEAAELMGVAAGTVYSSIWRARRKLARVLAEFDGISERIGSNPQ
ncbi:MAG TPA: RNA polymerase sigma factor [Terriglobales bacterium]|nr:RNA polymerase sigma factor [Terriglobales bacterium]